VISAKQRQVTNQCYWKSFYKNFSNYNSRFFLNGFMHVLCTIVLSSSQSNFRFAHFSTYLLTTDYLSSCNKEIPNCELHLHLCNPTKLSFLVGILCSSRKFLSVSKYDTGFFLNGFMRV